MEIFYWIICWFSHSRSSVRILKNKLLNSVVADVTDASIRNSWLSRLDSIVSAAFIIGPAIGGILSKVNYHFPLYNEYQLINNLDIALVLYLVLQ